MFLQVRNGHIKRITDNDIQSLVLEVEGTNVRWVCVTIHLSDPDHMIIMIRPDPCVCSPQHHLHHVSRRPQENSRHQTALPRHDHQESQEVFHIWSSGRDLVIFQFMPLKMIQHTWCISHDCDFRCWMIRMCGGGSGRVTIRARRAWSPSSVRCPWGWTTAGTRSSSTCQTSRAERTAPITSRLSECRWAHENTCRSHVSPKSGGTKWEIASILRLIWFFWTVTFSWHLNLDVLYC